MSCLVRGLLPEMSDRYGAQAYSPGYAKIRKMPEENDPGISTGITLIGEKEVDIAGGYGLPFSKPVYRVETATVFFWHLQDLRVFWVYSRWLWTSF